MWEDEEVVIKAAKPAKTEFATKQPEHEHETCNVSKAAIKKSEYAPDTCMLAVLLTTNTFPGVVFRSIGCTTVLTDINMHKLKHLELKLNLISVLKVREDLKK